MITERSKSASLFKAIPLPTGVYAVIPAGLNILIPKAPRIAPEDRHFLAYLPWEYKYYQYIPAEYRSFFTYVLPFLHARTSNVHTALSIAQLPHLLKNTSESVSERLLYLALILHDTGWSQVSQQDILQSLNYSSVTPNASSMRPKQQHLVYGEALAYQLLDTFDFEDDIISSHDMYTISEMIRRHDHDAAWEQGKYGPIGFDVKLMCDSDRLWSYTHENFWLDTVRKGVAADIYVKTIGAEIPAYFMTHQGKTRARQLLKERKAEVDHYLKAMDNAGAYNTLVLKAHYPTGRLIYRTRQLLLSARSRRLQRALIRQNAY